MCEKQTDGYLGQVVCKGGMEARQTQVSERDSLIEQYQEFVEGLVSHFMRVMALPERHRDDFIAAGLLGLVEAAGRFDAARGSDFRSFAYLRIRGAVIDHVRASCELSGQAYQMLKALESAQEMRERSVEDRAISRPSPASRQRQALDFLTKSAVALTMAHCASEYPFFGGQPPTDPERELVKKQLSQKIRETLATLPEKERTIVEQYYFHDLTLGEVAQRYSGLSKSWVSRLHERALEMLRDKLVAKGISP